MASGIDLRFACWALPRPFIVWVDSTKGRGRVKHKVARVCGVVCEGGRKFMIWVGLMEGKNGLGESRLIFCCVEWERKLKILPHRGRMVELIFLLTVDEVYGKLVGVVGESFPGRYKNRIEGKRPMNKIEEKDYFVNLIHMASDAGAGYVADALRSLQIPLYNSINADFSGEYAVHQLEETIKDRMADLSDVEMKTCQAGEKLAARLEEVHELGEQIDVLNREVCELERKKNALAEVDHIFRTVYSTLTK